MNLVRRRSQCVEKFFFMTPIMEDHVITFHRDDMAQTFLIREERSFFSVVKCPSLITAVTVSIWMGSFRSSVIDNENNQ